MRIFTTTCTKGARGKLGHNQSQEKLLDLGKEAHGVEKDTSHPVCNTKAEIPVKMKMFDDLTRDSVRNAYCRFQSRFEVKAEAEED